MHLCRYAGKIMVKNKRMGTERQKIHCMHQIIIVITVHNLTWVDEDQ